MQGRQESTGRRTAPWPKRMAREKKTRRRTVQTEEEKQTHSKISKESCFWLVEAQSKEEQYRVSLPASVIGVCIKDVHCLSTVVVPADQPVPFASVPLQPHANVE